jgi:hypothetical protein
MIISQRSGLGAREIGYAIASNFRLGSFGAGLSDLKVRSDLGGPN